MKKMRIVSLALTLGLLTLYARPVSADACCQAFKNFCNGECGGSSHVLMTDCNVGMSHDDYCWCEGDGASPTWTGPAWCAPL